MINTGYLNLEEDYCSECGNKQSIEYLYRSCIDNKLYCIYCMGEIKKKRENKYPISKYERRGYKNGKRYRKILL